MILVTGALGGIGKHLVSYLANDRKYDVLAVDMRDDTDWSRFLPLHITWPRRYVRYLSLNVRDGLAIPELFRSHKIDAVIHLAAMTSIEDCDKMPYEALLDNILATRMLVRESEKNSVGRFVYASTSAVYGRPKGIVTEKAYTKPVNLYGISKLAAEHIVHADTILTRATSLRLANVYGPGITRGVIANYIWSAKGGEALEIYGNGHQTRGFLYVDDVLEAFDKALNSSSVGTYNVAAMEYWAIHHVADMVIDQFAVSGNPGVVYRDVSSGVSELRMDGYAAEIALNWKPKTRLLDGLQRIRDIGYR